MDEVALDEPFDKTATRGTEAVGTGAEAVVAAGVTVGVTYGVRAAVRGRESSSISKPKR